MPAGRAAMSAVRRSILFSAVDKYVAQILLVATTAVMARILTPAETGLYLVAGAMILLVDNFRTFGVGVFIVQAPDLQPETVRSAFTITLLLSVLAGAGVFAAAGPMADFYGDAELAGLLRLSALSFLAVPFGTPLIALLQRDLAVRPLAVANVAAAVASAAVTVGLGLAGFGAASYVWGFIASGFVTTLVVLAQRPEPWVFRPCLAGSGRIPAFGTTSAAVTVVNMANDLLPRLIFGRLLGFDAVALYGRATTICQLPDRALVQALQPVVLPAMAAHRRQGGDLKRSYLHGHAMMSVFQWPALVMLALLAEPVVRVLLGSQWFGSVPLVRLMAVATMALAPAFMTYPVLVATGRIRDTLTSSLIALPPSVLIFWIAANSGVEAAAASLLIAAPLQMGAALFFVRRAIGISIRDLVEASRASLSATLGTAFIPGLIVALSPNGLAPSWPETAVALLGGGLGWLAAVRLVRHPVCAEIDGLVELLARRLSRRTTGLPARANEGG